MCEPAGKIPLTLGGFRDPARRPPTVKQIERTKTKDPDVRKTHATTTGVVVTSQDNAFVDINDCMCMRAQLDSPVQGTQPVTEGDRQNGQEQGHKSSE